MKGAPGEPSSTCIISSTHLNRGLQRSGLSGADYNILAVLSGYAGDRMPSTNEFCGS